MGFLDKAKDAVASHDEQVDQGLDKAEGFAKGKLDDKGDAHVDTASDKARSAIDGLGSKND